MDFRAFKSDVPKPRGPTHCTGHGGPLGFEATFDKDELLGAQYRAVGEGSAAQHQ